MQANWSTPDRDAWDALHRRVAASLQQDWVYGEALRALGTPCLRAEFTLSAQPIGVAQCLVRKMGGVFSLALCSQGPVWSPESSPEQRREAIGLFRRTVPLHWPRVCLLTPDSPDAQADGMTGRIRVVTGHSTVRIDLDRTPDLIRAAMNGKWRNRLAAAERSELKVQRVGNKPAQYRWLLDRELAQRSARRYIALPDGFVEAWQTHGGGLLTLRADRGRDAVAGMMFLIHGEAATYQVGWMDEAGRELGAHNLLLWQAMLALRERGVRRLDLGGVDTVRSGGIARFKIGTGGEVLTLAGTFL